MFEFLSFKVLNEISALFSASKFRVVQFSMINSARSRKALVYYIK